MMLVLPCPVRWWFPGSWISAGWMIGAISSWGRGSLLGGDIFGGPALINRRVRPDGCSESCSMR